MNSRLIGLLILLAFLTQAYSARVLGCSIPVFRYALENWIPDAYHALVVSQGPLTIEEMALVTKLQQAHTDSERPSNVRVQTIDVTATDLESDSGASTDGDVPSWVLKRLEKQLKAAASEGTQLVLLYPRVWDRFAWQAPLDDANVGRLLDSPARRQVAERLLDGQSAVWVLVESDDAGKNEDAWKRLVSELERIEGVVQLPARELIVAEDQFRADVDEAIKLRVEFSAIRLSKSDAAESAFASMLRQSEPDLDEFADQPIAVPIYGRGRTYFALVGDGINAQTVEGNGHFICGACSCEVKRENPGVDVLFAVNWEAGIGGSAMPDVVLPELTGIGGFEASVTSVDASAAQARTTQSASDVIAKLPSRDSAASRQLAPELPATTANAQPVTHVTPDLAASAPVGSQPVASAHSSTGAATSNDMTHSGAAADASMTANQPATATDEASRSFGVSLLVTLVGGVGLAVCALGFIVYWLDRRR